MSTIASNTGRRPRRWAKRFRTGSRLALLYALSGVRQEAAALRANPKELANSLTHGFGFALSVAGAVFLLVAAATHGGPWCVLGCGLYAVTLVLVYAASTLSHAFQDERLNRLFRMLDQGFIYLLIAGTYTPFGLTYLRYGWWWLLTAAMWLIALWGCYSKLVLAHRIESVSISACLVLGWLPIMAVKPMLMLMPLGALVWMIAGGVLYTVGTLFLKWDERGTYYHATWHVAVIAGSVCHYMAILLYVAPGSA